MSSISITVSETFKSGRANYSSEGSTISISPTIDGDITIYRLRAFEATLQYEAHLAILNAQVLNGDILPEQVPHLMKPYADLRDAALRKAGMDNVNGNTTINGFFGR